MSTKKLKSLGAILKSYCKAHYHLQDFTCIQNCEYYLFCNESLLNEPINWDTKELRAFDNGLKKLLLIAEKTKITIEKKPKKELTSFVFTCNDCKSILHDKNCQERVKTNILRCKDFVLNKDC